MDTNYLKGTIEMTAKKNNIPVEILVYYINNQYRQSLRELAKGNERVIDFNQNLAGFDKNGEIFINKGIESDPEFMTDLDSKTKGNKLPGKIAVAVGIGLLAAMAACAPTQDSGDSGDSGDAPDFYTNEIIKIHEVDYDESDGSQILFFKPGEKGYLQSVEIKVYDPEGNHIDTLTGDIFYTDPGAHQYGFSINEERDMESSEDTNIADDDRYFEVRDPESKGVETNTAVGDEKGEKPRIVRIKDVIEAHKKREAKEQQK